MDDIQIMRGGERKRLLFFGGVLFGFVALVNLTCLPVIVANGRDPEPNVGLQDGLLTLASCAFISGILCSTPAFLYMAILKRLRCVQYVAAVIAFGIAGAVVLGSVYYSVDMIPGPFPWRTHVLSDTLRGAIIGFHLGLLGGSFLAPFALLFLPPRALPRGFDDDEGAVIPESGHPGIRPAGGAAIREPR